MRRAWLPLAAAAVIVAGAWAFSVTQRISFGNGLYFSLETASTVGFGDITPENGPGKVIAVVLILVAIPLLAATFALLTSLHIRKHVDKRLAEHHESIRKLIKGGETSSEEKRA